MAYTPPSFDSAGFDLSGSYSAPAWNQAGFDLGDVFISVESETIIGCAFIAPVESACQISWALVDALVEAAAEISAPLSQEVMSDTAVYRPPVIESVSLVIRSDARLINQSVQIVRRAAALAEQPCEMVRASMAWVGSGCSVLLAAASALVEAGFLVERESLSRTPVEGWCEIITIDSSQPASGATAQALAGAVSGATTPEGVPVAAGSYTAADLAAGRVIDLGNATIDPIGISLTLDRGAYAITGSLELGTEAEFAACTIGRDIALQVGSETVQLRVADRKRSRAHGQWRYTVELQSPSAWLDAPWAEPAAGTYSGTAASIAAAIAAGAEHPVAISWQTVSWPIPADTVLANGSSPLELIRQIKDAAGAVLQSLHDGSLVVEPEYPVALPQWATAAPSYTVVEADEVVIAEDDADWRDGNNAYLVGNVSAGTSSAGGDIRISEIDSPDRGKTIRVATVPWNPSMRLSHRGGTWVQLSGLGDRSRSETETVQIIDGVGRLQYRFDGLVASDYLEAELGSIGIAEDGTVTTATRGDTLIAITYTTRSRDYQLTNPSAEEVMVVAEADDDAVAGVGTVSVLVTRGDGLNQGQEFTSDLITTAAVAMEKGRNLIDATCSPRQLVTLLMPYRGLWRTGRLVSVHDATMQPWVGMLRSQQISISVADDGSQTWDSTITLEREAA